MSTLPELVPQLKRLRLSGVLDTLDVRNQQALAEKWSYVEFLSRLVTDEVERRAAGQLALRLRRGQVDTTKTLETFDFDFNPTLHRRQVFDLATYLKPDLLVLDDFGLKPLPPSGPDDLYDVIDGRYEKKSILVTSNRAPDEWTEILGNPLLANAALDRLLDRAHIVSVTGRSYRLAGRPNESEAPDTTNPS